jgi:hypothetical protein
LALREEQRHVLRFYTALYCVDFMSGLGHAFNRERADDHSQELVRLSKLLDEHLG